MLTNRQSLPRQAGSANKTAAALLLGQSERRLQKRFRVARHAARKSLQTQGGFGDTIAVSTVGRRLVCDAQRDFRLVKVLHAADKHLKFCDDAGKWHCLSECVDSISAYMQLDDRILYLVETSRSPELAEARRLLTQLNMRQQMRSLGKSCALKIVSHRRKNLKLA